VKLADNGTESDQICFCFVEVSFNVAILEFKLKILGTVRLSAKYRILLHPGSV
jgi:hypothetical protein